MAYTAYAKFSGIDGGSTDSSHPKWIDVLSFNWGASGISKQWEPSDREGKRAAMNGFSIIKRLDEASPGLHTKGASGEKISEVKVELVEKLPGRQGWYRKFMEYRFETCYVTGVNPVGSQGGDHPLEDVRVAFEKMTFKQG